MQKTSETLQPGDIQFYDNSLSSLPGGAYEIAVKLSLPNTATDNFTETYRQNFRVQAPQFVLPDTDIVSMYPASAANGNFSEYLPAIVLDNPAFPWERQIDPGDAKKPWMALLIFRESEIKIDPATGTSLINTTVGEFLKEEEGIVKPSIDPMSLPAEELEIRMNSILISTEVFQAITPRVQELSSLAHVREVNPEDQEVSGSLLDGWFSVVIANRFPYSGDGSNNAGAINYAHLVSIEGLTQYLVDSPDWKNNKSVQLVSLANWTFTAVPQKGETFADLAENLITQAGTPEQLLLRIPVTNDGSVAAQRLEEGYTALSYHTLPGPKTFSWYRGPFSPVVPQSLPGNTFIHPSQAMIYDQQQAIFDNSYADAWNTGRLVALADPAFILSVQRSSSRLNALATRLFERSKLPHLAHITDLHVLAEPGITRKLFITQVKNGLSEQLSSVFEEKGAQKSRTAGSSGNFLFPGEEMPAGVIEAQRWFRAKKEIRDFLKADLEEDVDPIASWMANLMLLYNVPFNHLAPDQRMLPSESIRFFHVDAGWLRALFDGAMNVLSHSSRDLDSTALLKEIAWPATLKKTAAVRRKLLRKKTESEDLPLLPAAGMLLRSALVSGWPGLAINATENGNPVNILRIDRVSTSILLVLWDKVPDTVSISEPQQGIVFGAEERGAERIVKLRSLDAANLGAQLGQDFPTTGSITQFFRPVQNATGGNVLQLVPEIKNTAGYLVPSMSSQLGLSDDLLPAQLAIEMVKAPQQIVFNPPLSR